MNTTPTTAQQLQTIARLWPDLTDALGDRTQHAWPPQELKGYLNALDRADSVEAAALRALERSPDQLGTRPVPISLRVHDTMRAVEAALLDTADRIARSVQRAPQQPPAPARAATASTRAERLVWEDRARRIEAARRDACDPRRWQPQHGRTAIRAALWLSGRAAGASGPFRPLSDVEEQHLARVAAGALARVEAVLDLADTRRELTAEHACQCGGTIEVYGGAGARPVARCKGCGAIWSEGGVIAA
ncbi:hypothetical protein PUR59_04280 [Streptomyces sp. SP18ES09]|uniref:hypothetical protein n=1 Tax=Streptomyces sp. SP18ES09 TaxID=3002532 RepID=UPI002E77434E|nr:hypothetical protein [Streptomyces sp. SP18ES09]MEE1814238.1 hypothetical protein [Streptomyces sp. SP18ES09]